MKRNRMAVAALASVLAAVAGALAFANNLESGPAPTADVMKNGALAALRAAGGEWVTLDRGAAAGSWNARVLRADGSIADVRMDDQFHVVGVDGAKPASGVPALAAGIDDDRETPVPASDAARAGKAALDAVGGGTVESVDRDREGGATWEVEVTKTDGTRADVLLDGQFRLISVGGEQEPNEGPDDASDDDHGQPDD